MPNAKNLGVGLLVTALIVGIVGKEAYSTGNWRRVAADFNGKYLETPFTGNFAANSCGGDKLGRSTKGAECEIEFDMSLNYQGKTFHVGNQGMDVNGVHIDHKVETEGDLPEIKQIGPNTIQVGDNLELTITNARNAGSRSLLVGGFNWGFYNNPYAQPLYYIFNPPVPPPTPSPTYQCDAHREAAQHNSVSCIGGLIQSGIVSGGLALSGWTAGLSLVASFLVSSAINWAFSSTLTGVSTIDCGKLAAIQTSIGQDHVCNPSWFSIDWSMPPMTGGF